MEHRGFSGIFSGETILCDTVMMDTYHYKFVQTHGMYNSWASLVAQMVKNPPAMRETWVRSLGWEDSLEEGMGTHSSIIAWRIPMERGPWQVAVHRVSKSQT